MSFQRYPLSYNPILEYWHRIESGEETVSIKVRKVFRHLAKKLGEPVPGELLSEEERAYHYDPRRANHVLEFAENFCHN